MSHYYPRYCEKHGEWDQDVDFPDEECPQCVEQGCSPSQLAEAHLKAITKQRDALLAAAKTARRVIHKLTEENTTRTPQYVVECVGELLAAIAAAEGGTK